MCSASREIRTILYDNGGVLNEELDYTKTRNYWKYLKAKLKKENSQLVSATTQLKLTAADGKKYKTDMLDSEGIIELSKNFPNNKATKFLDRFLYSDTSIDGQSKKKAYTLFESNLINEFEVGTTKTSDKQPDEKEHRTDNRVYVAIAGDVVNRRSVHLALRTVKCSEIRHYD